ncbi:MFS transporter [Geodermatophilus ruber]|uniref:Predicted arabinose efflux permease, MFS family n=1 Tax=Geodermatophilus ruber TaxID=504800 RepID=A0A1I4IP04_9ACTN|nr:MFS transporter [Geodermatophilus ruber]SFL55797.1 Predicted arabinose efflux permease, MFS family [Geodermatophilus ruber]
MTLPVLSRARTSTTTPPAPPSLRQLRVAVAVLFALDGFVFGTWAARIPDVSAQLGASHSSLGIAVLCLSLGALAFMQLTGALSARLGPGRVSVAAAVLVSLATALPGLAGSVPQLCVALFFFGAATGAVNVAANSLGVQVEARWGRPLLPSLHAGFSFGGLAGALVGGLVSVVAGVAPHLLGVTVAGLAVLAWIGPTLARADDAAPPLRAARTTGEQPDRPRGTPTAVLVVLGAVAGCTSYGEGALTDWGALYLREDLGATSVLAAAGYAAFALAMACGRLLGSALVVTLGEDRLLVGGALLAAAGMLVAAWTGSVTVALAGFVLVGLGLANVFPLAIARAGALGGAGGVALASTVGYSGLLGGPPLLGFLAEFAGLPLALSTVSVLAVVAAVLVLSLRGEPVAVRRPAVFGLRRPAVVTWVSARLQPVGRSARTGARQAVEDLRILAVS